MADTARTRARAYVSIALLALLAWGALLLTPDALFWDDWVVVNDDTLAVYQEVGLPWVGPIIVALFGLGPWSFKVVAIVSTIVVGCAAYAISGRGFGLNSWERWLLSALVVVLPLNSARDIAILSPYAWSTALFFIAWFLVVRRSPDAPGRLRYVAAAVLLFASYTTASLLPFTALPAAHLLFLSLSDEVSLRKSVILFVRRFWWLALAPVSFWVMKAVFFKPHGLYENYNQISLHRDVFGYGVLALAFVVIVASGVLVYVFVATRRKPRAWEPPLLLAVLAIVTAAVAAFLYTIKVSAVPVALVPAIALGGCALVLFGSVLASTVRRMRAGDAEAASQKRAEPLLAVGLIALAVAIIPYLLVAKIPSFDSWETRHQLLMPLGFAVVLVATARSAMTWIAARVVRIVSLAGLAVALLISIMLSLALVVDWRKQMQVSDALADSTAVQSASTVVFADRASHYNFLARPYTVYEYSGWLWTAFGDRTRIGVAEAEVPNLLNGGYSSVLSEKARYGIDDYVPSTGGVLVEVVPVDGTSWWDLLVDRPSVDIRVTPIDDLSSIR